MTEITWNELYQETSSYDVSAYKHVIAERDKPFKNFLKKEIRLAKPILDIGANLFSESYLPKKDVVAVNLSFAGLAHQLKYPVNADGLSLPFKKEAFPVVLSRNTYGYIDKPEQLIEEMIRVLKSKGKFILIDMAGPTTQLNEFFPGMPPRLNDFYPKEIISKLPLSHIKQTVLINSSLDLPSGSIPVTIEAITGIKK